MEKYKFNIIIIIKLADIFFYNCLFLKIYIYIDKNCIFFFLMKITLKIMNIILVEILIFFA